MRNACDFPKRGRAGFTVLELLVASLLLSMLVTILTMIFNQSSIAWRAGVASVNDLQDVREQMGGYHEIYDDALPGIGQANATDVSSRRIEYRTVSIFRNWNGKSTIQQSGPSKQCSGRLIDRIDWGDADPSQITPDNAMRGKSISTSGGNTYGQARGGFVVGVRSAGPNREMGDDDDIDTFPEDIN